jgi:hypothetical protein
MSKPTNLSAGSLNGSDRLTVQLIDGDTPTVAIVWPTAVTVTSPAAYDQTAATAMRILAAASTALAHRKARKHL